MTNMENIEVVNEHVQHVEKNKMCYQPIKLIPKRYKTSVELYGRFIETPLYDNQIYNAKQTYSYFPCGKCYECRESKIEAWAIRWHEHLKHSVQNSSYMLTLTYNSANLPLLNNHKSTLDYTDVQKFLKRLRKHQFTYCKKHNIENPKISYHGCGEYGNKRTKRPHYHILITNVIIPQENIQILWGKGQVHIGDDVTSQTIQYVLKYTLKHSIMNEKYQRVEDKNGKFKYNILTTGKNKGRVKEKSFCSKGIGKAFLTPEVITYYENNPQAEYLYRNINKNGNIESKIKPMPRYYKEIIYNPNIIENGKIKRDHEYRPIKKYQPLSEDFENTPRFKRLLHIYKREQAQINQIVQYINLYGYDNYLNQQITVKKEKFEKYKRQLKAREIEQEYKNKTNAAVYC